MIKPGQNGFSKMTLTLVLPFIVLAFAYAAYMLFFVPEPKITGQEALSLLPAHKTVTIHGENLKSIRVSVYQGGNKLDLLSDKPGLKEMTYTLEIKPKDLQLKDGTAIILIEARSGFFKKFKQEIRTTIDMVPPKLQVMRAPSILNEGSSGVVVLRAKEADAVTIKLGDKHFKAYEAPPASRSKAKADMKLRGTKKKTDRVSAKTYITFIPAPFGVHDKDIYYAIAQDLAGNQSVKTLYTKIKTKKHKKSSIKIDRTFVDRVIAPLLNESDIADPVGAFRKVNEEWRDNSHKNLLQIASDSEPDMLWEGRFLQMRNSKVMATYGDERTYIYEGQRISKSVHLGFDLASHSNAPVEAANSGIVKFAGDLSIYGYTVVLDHGFGLMSLYGHLSSIIVEEGDSVNRGDIVGHSGSSGLAGGDHLHFGMLVQGYEVSPLYWWDTKWINVHVMEYLNN